MTATDERAGAPVKAHQLITDSTYSPERINPGDQKHRLDRIVHGYASGGCR